MRSTLLLILALVSFGSAAFAREFYVATDGPRRQSGDLRQTVRHAGAGP